MTGKTAKGVPRVVISVFSGCPPVSSSSGDSFFKMCEAQEERKEEKARVRQGVNVHLKSKWRGLQEA